MRRSAPALLPLLLVLGTAGPALLLAGGARAESASLRAELAQSLNWSDNPLLSSGAHDELWGSTTTPSLKFRDEQPTRKLSLDLSVSRNQFNRSVFNSTDLSATGKLVKDIERWSFKLEGNGAYDTTRTSEETSYGLRDAVARRTYGSVNPTISFRPTSLSEWAVAGGYGLTSYDKASYTDYETFSLTPSYTRFLSETTSVFVATQAQRYVTTEGVENQTDSIGPSIGFTRAFSPRFDASFSTGAQASRQSVGGHPVGAWYWQQTLEARATFKGKTDKISVAAKRAQAPYGNGTQALRTNVALDIKHAINEDFSLGLGGGYSYSEYEQASNGNLRRSMNGRAELAYRLNDAVELAASYRYARQRLVGDATAAESNTAMLHVRLHPNGWSLGY
jgi:hypothetical protein